MTRLSEIEGVGEVFATKLEEAGVSSISSLLESGCEKKGRQMIAEKTGISEKLILNWVNRADLARIKGISTQYADLLEYAGVDTVPELAMRNPQNLTTAIKDVNMQKKLVRKIPALSQVENWIEQAKELPKLITH